MRVTLRLGALVLCTMLSAQVAVSQSPGSELWKEIAKRYEPPKPTPPAKPPAPSSNNGKTTVSSSAKYSSVCARSWAKLTSDLVHMDPPVGQAFATYDLVARDVMVEEIKLVQPCIAYDNAMKSLNDALAQGISNINVYCAGPHARAECLPWGYAEDINKPYFETIRRIVQKIVSDPEYSADLGTAYTPGAGTAPSASAESPEDKACAAELDRLGAALAQTNKTLGTDVIRPLEISMGYSNASAAAIAARCPNSAKYKPQREMFLKSLADAKKTCDAMASRPCTARMN
jgi:hypothetical protein